MKYFFDRNLETKELDSLIESIGWEIRGQELWNELLTHFSQGIVYTRDQDRLIGIVRGFPVERKAFLVGDLLVDEEYQRRGLGEDLLGKLRKRFRTREFFLEAVPESVSFYERCGFEKIGCCIFGKYPMKLNCRGPITIK